jgi:hypothetical protein
MYIALTIMVIVWGAGIGLVQRAGKLAQWLAVGVTVTAGIGTALASWVVVEGNPWKLGGTLAHYRMPDVLREPFATLLGIVAVGLLCSMPLIFGIVMGSLGSFRRESHGLLRFGFCIAACVSVLAIDFWICVVTFT